MITVRTAGRKSTGIREILTYEKTVRFKFRNCGKPTEKYGEIGGMRI